MKTIAKRTSMGQVSWDREGEIRRLRHIQDQGKDIHQLRGVETLEALEEVVRWDEQGRFRPLRSEGNLVSGWVYQVKGEEGFREAMEVIYPGLWGNAEAWNEGRLKFQSWDEAMEKQTERIRSKVAKMGDLPASVIEKNCRKRCLKVVVWAGEKPEEKEGEVPMICTGPCGMFWSCLEG